MFCYRLILTNCYYIFFTTKLIFHAFITGEYAVRFIPRENGLHLVHVLFDNYHIPDSPFRIMVGKVDAADAGKVTAYGEGLHTGKTGLSKI